jgi:hypothetical protein
MGLGGSVTLTQENDKVNGGVGLTMVTPSLRAARRGMVYPNLERNILLRKYGNECRKLASVEEIWIQERMA